MMAIGWKNAVIQVVGMATAGLTGAAIGVLANAVYKGGADAGDWLQFFGGVLGAFLAVLAAVYFENMRQNSAVRHQIEFVNSVLTEFGVNMRTLKELPPPDNANFQEMAVRLLSMNDGMRAVLFAIEAVPASTLTSMDALRRRMWLMEELNRYIATNAKFREDVLDQKASADLYKSLSSRFEVAASMAEEFARAIGRVSNAQV